MSAPSYPRPRRAGRAGAGAPPRRGPRGDAPRRRRGRGRRPERPRLGRRRARAACRAAHLLAGYGGLPETLAHMRAAGVERVTLQSGSSATASDGTDNAVARYHISPRRRSATRASRRHSCSPTASRPTRWSGAISSPRGTRCAAPFADVAVSAIDPRDIAAVAAHALTAGDLDGRTLRLSGPEALRPADRLRILGEVLGRDLTLAPSPTTRPAPDAHDDAGGLRRRVLLLLRRRHDRRDDGPARPSRRSSAAPPRTFRAWAEEHAGAFR